MRKVAVLGIALFLLAGSSGSALAADAPLAATREDAPRWYGWQTILVDVGSAALFVGGVASDSQPLMLTSLGTFMVGGPVVHGLHHTRLAPMRSLGLRFGLPIAGAVIGYGIGTMSGEVSGDFRPHQANFTTVGVPMGLGVLAAMALDSTFLAHEDAPVRSMGLRVSPSVVPVRGGMVAGAGGSF